MNHLAVSAATAAIILVAGSTGAGASCFEGLRSGAAAAQHRITVPTPHADLDAQNFGEHQIAGLWHTTYTAGGSVLLESFQQWHPDGLEWEFANIPPEAGDVCLGVWSRGPKSVVQLFHTAWTFNADGSVSGTMQLTGKYTVSNHGKAFSGPFTLKFLDTEGNILTTIEGDVSSVRIPAPAP